MPIGKRIKEARKANHLSQADLAKQLEITTQTVSRWERDEKKPDINKIEKLSRILRVEPNYFFPEGFLPSGIQADPFLLERYQKLSYRQQSLIDSLIDEFLDLDDIPVEMELSSSREPEDPDVFLDRNGKLRITSDLIVARVSAGLGMEIPEDQESEPIDLLYDEQTKKDFNYVVEVAGASMEPKFHDGDYLLIKECEEIGIGQIGIFRVDEKLYVKQLKDGYLHSLNPQYNDIPLSEGARCIGKVVGLASVE